MRVINPKNIIIGFLTPLLIPRIPSPDSRGWMQLVRPGCEENLQGYLSQWPGPGGCRVLTTGSLGSDLLTLSRDSDWASTCRGRPLSLIQTLGQRIWMACMDGCWDFVEKIHIFVSEHNLFIQHNKERWIFYREKLLELKKEHNYLYYNQCMWCMWGKYSVCTHDRGLR